MFMITLPFMHDKNHLKSDTTHKKYQNKKPITENYQVSHKSFAQKYDLYFCKGSASDIAMHTPLPQAYVLTHLLLRSKLSPMSIDESCMDLGKERS